MGRPASTRDSVDSRLQQRFDELTPAERQLASVLLEHYPMAGLSSITELASRADVSTPTVVRCAKKLGFDGFVAMQRAIRDEVEATLRDPIGRRATWQGGTEYGHLVDRFAEATASNVANTLRRLDRQVFDQVVEKVSAEHSRIFITGGRITRSIADYLFNHLQIIRPGVTELGTSSNIWPQYVVDMDDSAVVLLFDIRRYESDLHKLARLCAERNATLVLFTDQWGSPIARLADHRFDTLVEVPSPWDSTLAMMLLVECLIAAVQDRHWPASKERIQTLETMFGKTRLFRRFD